MNKLLIAVLFGLIAFTDLCRGYDIFNTYGDRLKNLENRRKKNAYNVVEKILPRSVSNIVRPVYNILEDTTTGLSSGLFNVDLDQPFFCLTDGITIAKSALDLYIAW